MADGIRDGMDAYRDANAWSCSDAEDLLESPRLLHLRRTGALPRRQGRALDLGTYVHLLLLEPLRAADLVVEAPSNPRTGKAYGRDTNAWAEFAAEHPGKLILTESDRELALRMVSAFYTGGSFAAQYLALEGPVEESIYWRDEATGLPLKCRPDKRVMGHFVLDLKTSGTSVRPYAFAQTCARRHYALRAAFYRRGVKALTGEPGRVAYVALPKEPPYEDVAWYEIHDDDVDVADRQLDRLLADLARRIESNDWTPPWVAQPNVIRLPGHAAAEHQWEAQESE